MEMEEDIEESSEAVDNLPDDFFLQPPSPSVNNDEDPYESQGINIKEDTENSMLSTNMTLADAAVINLVEVVLLPQHFFLVQKRLSCGELFYIQPSLDQHILEMHGTVEPVVNRTIPVFESDVLMEALSGSYRCKICHKTCSARCNMQKHVRKHTCERPFSCSICSATFKHCGAIKIHMRTHTGERPFSCIFCGKKFAQNSSKRRHENLHRGLRPFSCIACDKTFSEKATLQIHMLQHTGERPFVCEICGRGHVTKSALNQHRQRRHLNRSKNTTNKF